MQHSVFPDRSSQPRVLSAQDRAARTPAPEFAEPEAKISVSNRTALDVFNTFILQLPIANSPTTSASGILSGIDDGGRILGKVPARRRSFCAQTGRLLSRP